MQIDPITLLGLAAGTLTTASFIPQVVKTWRSRSAKDISLVMFSTFCIGILIWIIYGFFIKSAPVILTNIITFILAFIILVLKIKYK